MAAFETFPVQFERDLRSAHKDHKRHKDAATKWAYGSRALPGNRVDAFTDEVFDGTGAKATKFRPRHKWSDIRHSSVKPNPNIVKYNRNSANWLLPASRVRVSTNAYQEIRDASRSDLIWSPTQRSTNSFGITVNSPISPDVGCSSSGFLYSFDNTDSPPPVMTLDLFVKPNVRATEMLVEKEYEVIDRNGDALKGRKARQVLRKAAASGASHTAPVAATPNLIEVVDEEDFELV